MRGITTATNVSIPYCNSWKFAYEGETVRKLKIDCQIAQKMSAKTIGKLLKRLKYYKKIPPVRFKILKAAFYKTKSISIDKLNQSKP